MILVKKIMHDRKFNLSGKLFGSRTFDLEKILVIKINWTSYEKFKTKNVDWEREENL